MFLSINSFWIIDRHGESPVDGVWIFSFLPDFGCWNRWRNTYRCFVSILVRVNNDGICECRFNDKIDRIARFCELNQVSILSLNVYLLIASISNSTFSSHSILKHSSVVSICSEAQS